VTCAPCEAKKAAEKAEREKAAAEAVAAAS
jgi:hypothetical protein